MRRRTLVLSGLAPAILARRAQAQAPVRVATVGFLVGANRTTEKAWLEAFVGRLAELGWRDGTTLVLDVRDVDGSPERAAAEASDLVRRKVDLVVTTGTPAAQAAKRATDTIPVLFTLIADPVASGLVERLSRPGGNVTGLTNQQSEVAGKRLGLLREMVPALRRLGVLVNTTALGAVWEMESARAAAQAAGLAVQVEAVRSAEAIDPALARLAGSDALYVCADPLLAPHHRRINAFALANRLPATWGARSLIANGALMSYGPSYTDLMRRTADYADRILRGAWPGDLPVEQPVKFDFAVDLGVARTLGIAVPQTILVAADEVLD